MNWELFFRITILKHYPVQMLVFFQNSKLKAQNFPKLKANRMLLHHLESLPSDPSIHQIQKECLGNFRNLFAPYGHTCRRSLSSSTQLFSIHLQHLYFCVVVGVFFVRPCSNYNFLRAFPAKPEVEFWFLSAMPNDYFNNDCFTSNEISIMTVLRRMKFQ